MEQKHIYLSALGVGVGVGVGLGLGSGQGISKWSSIGAARNSSDFAGANADEIELELRRLLVDGKESSVTFDDFTYYISERIRMLLMSAAYVHLNHSDVSKHTRNLSAASSAILLSSVSELYHQMLAKALSHYFKAKLLLLDVTDFSMKMQGKYGSCKRETPLKNSVSDTALGRVSSLLGSFSILAAGRDTEDPLKRVSSWSFDEKTFVQSLYKVLVSVSETNSIILYIRDVEKLLLQSPRLYNLFDKMLKNLPGPVLLLGSQMLESDDASRDIDEKVTKLFSYTINIKPPEDESALMSWKAQVEEDMKTIQSQDNKNHIAEVLAANDLECYDLDSICQADSKVLNDHIQEIVVSALTFHLMNNKEPEYRNGKLLISSKSLSHGLSFFQEEKNSGKDNLKLETNESTKVIIGGDIIGLKSESKSTDNKSDADKTGSKQDGENKAQAKVEVPDNEFEKRIRPEVIPANEIGVTFADIGSLEETKESLQELVMLPLRRPDLFNGGLLKPCRGILLFGPPGTGKTMLAKAIAHDAGASFINVSMSTITSKWFGEDEKNVRALFTLAAKVSPTIIFVDEVDSMLGQRTRTGEHEAMRKIKNEFMTHWDGLLTKPGERILVLAATNRPFDLDEAIIRRFERRIMVGLPSAESREKILRTLLAKEKVEHLDFKELATMTEGYSGSDLKVLCVTAAYRPVRELIQQEREKDLEKKQKSAEGKDTENKEENKEESERVITLRSLNMEDLRQAKNQVAASFASEGSVMSELKQWNALYGEGGSRKKEQLSYFL
nr:PREDICTED: peroxisome biosynthesis protein PAS1-like [Daucus carota subsp. sativus]